VQSPAPESRGVAQWVGAENKKKGKNNKGIYFIVSQPASFRAKFLSSKEKELFPVNVQGSSLSPLEKSTTPQN
jgi:hypothetical protein